MYAVEHLLFVGRGEGAGVHTNVRVRIVRGKKAQQVNVLKKDFPLKLLSTQYVKQAIMVNKNLSTHIIINRLEMEERKEGRKHGRDYSDTSLRSTSFKGRWSSVSR